MTIWENYLDSYPFHAMKDAIHLGWQDGKLQDQPCRRTKWKQNVSSLLQSFTWSLFCFRPCETPWVVGANHIEHCLHYIHWPPLLPSNFESGAWVGPHLCVSCVSHSEWISSVRSIEQDKQCTPWDLLNGYRQTILLKLKAELLCHGLPHIHPLFTIQATYPTYPSNNLDPWICMVFALAVLVPAFQTQATVALPELWAWPGKEPEAFRIHPSSSYLPRCFMIFLPEVQTKPCQA